MEKSDADVVRLDGIIQKIIKPYHSYRFVVQDFLHNLTVLSNFCEISKVKKSNVRCLDQKSNRV